MNLAPFSTFKIPYYHLENYMFHNNRLFCFGRGHFLIYELDAEERKP